MTIADIGLARTLRLIAAAISAMVAISLPLGYWLVVYSFAAEATAQDAAAHADLVTRRINADPELWRFEIPRLDAIVATHSLAESVAEKHVILDERGAVIVQNTEILSSPVLTRSATLLDSGTVVGRFVTSRSLLPLLRDTAIVAVFGLALAFAVYFSLSVLPLRALTRALGALAQERERLRAIVDNAVEGIVTFDSHGILQSSNPTAERMFDFSGAEGVGSSARDLLPEIDLAQAGLPGTQMRLGRLETVGRRKDGSRFPIELALSQAMLDGKPQLIAIAHDISERKRAEQVLQESNKQLQVASEQLEVVIQSAPLAIYTRDLNGLLTSWNPAAETMYGWKAAEVLGKPLPSVPGEARAESDGLRTRLLRGESFIKHEAHRRRRDGSPIDIDAFLAPLRDAAGEINGIIAVVADITERKQAEQASRDRAKELRLFAENVPAMTAAYDEKLHCLFGNKRYADFFGFRPENIVGKHLREIIGEDAHSEVEGHFAQALQGHAVTYQRTRMLANGEPRYLEVKLLPHIGDQGRVVGCFAVTTDITEHRLAEERIQTVAHHDSLTGLPNRLLFNDRLTQAISLAKRDSRQFALLYLDLDKFKPVNDTLGHAVGDELLKAVAARIRQQVRESDTVARIGGDEFTVILPDIAKREEAETVAGKIVVALVTPFQLSSPEQAIEIGTSIGIALYPADGQDADALVKAADAVMYSAKALGNSFRFCDA